MGIAIAKLDDWLEAQDTLPEFRQAIISRLRSWHQSGPTAATDYDWPGVNEAIQLQDHLGWLALFDGVVPDQWIDLQQNYFEWLGKRNTGFRWATSLIQKLLLLSWDMWKDRQKAWKDPTSVASVAQNQDLDDQIRQVYASDRSTWSTRDRRWCRRPTEDVCSLASDVKLVWLAHVAATTARIARRQNPGLELERRLMRCFLNRRPLQPP